MEAWLDQLLVRIPRSQSFEEERNDGHLPSAPLDVARRPTRLCAHWGLHKSARSDDAARPTLSTLHVGATKRHKQHHVAQGSMSRAGHPALLALKPARAFIAILAGLCLSQPCHRRGMHTCACYGSGYGQPSFRAHFRGLQ